MLERFLDLRRNILKQTAATGDVHRLHASADAEQWKVGLSCQVHDVQFEVCTTFAHDAEWIALALTI